MRHPVHNLHIYIEHIHNIRRVYYYTQVKLVIFPLGQLKAFTVFRIHIKIMTGFTILTYNIPVLMPYEYFIFSNVKNKNMDDNTDILFSKCKIKKQGKNRLKKNTCFIRSVVSQGINCRPRFYGDFTDKCTDFNLI